MSEYRSTLRQPRAILLVAVAILGLSLVSACGGAKNSKVELSISPDGLSMVENAAPTKDYALYVAAASVPGSVADLGSYTFVQCTTGETAVNRIMAVASGIGAGTGGSTVSIAGGDSTTEGIKKALSGAKTLVLVKRGSQVPADAVEVVLK